MPVFAEIVLDPSTVVAWLAVGVIAGWLAGQVTEAPSYGLFGDVLVGAIGGVVSGALLGLFVQGDPGFWPSVLVALIGALVVIGGARVIAARGSA